MAKNTLQNFPDPLISNKSMASSFVGTPSNIAFFDNIGAQLNWTGSNPIGTIGFQVSINYDPRFPAIAVWTPVETSPGVPLTVVPVGTAGNAYVDFNQLSAPWFQITYTTAGGSVGNLTSFLTAKGLQ